jgi:hypothetical protein
VRSLVVRIPADRNELSADHGRESFQKGTAFWQNRLIPSCQISPVPALTDGFFIYTFDRLKLTGHGVVRADIRDDNISGSRLGDAAARRTGHSTLENMWTGT